MLAIKVRVIGLILLSPPLKLIPTAEPSPRPGCGLTHIVRIDAAATSKFGRGKRALLFSRATHQKRGASIFEYIIPAHKSSKTGSIRVVPRSGSSFPRRRKKLHKSAVEGSRK